MIEEQKRTRFCSFFDSCRKKPLSLAWMNPLRFIEAKESGAFYFIRFCFFKKASNPWSGRLL
ncbi:predicted protein [Enterococcus casseliflavus EC30]|nr:predicted protein [Enterococcus casseliflavus EC30]